MKTLHRLIPIFCLCLWTLPRVHGQDIHFSQIDINPTLFNPAYTGFFDGTGRIGANYRNQWASISEPFQTFSVSAECSILRNRKHKLGVNFGLYAYRDQAGALNYGTTAGDIIISAYHGLSSTGSSLISGALSLGYGSAGFDDANASMSDVETFDTKHVSFFNISTGVAFYHQFSEDLYIKLGLSGQHLNRPNISYMGLDSTYLERKFNLYARADYRVAPTVSLLPVLAVQMQKQYLEAISGMNVKWFLDETYGHQLALTGGLLLRVGDAIIFDLGIDLNAFTFALSYDANISKLASASHSIGAFEIGILYKFNPSAHGNHKAISCPVF